ncbi:alanine racemase [Peptoniphilus sp. ING2-D1G]|nr:alanine racemase [Peptoniphilus sp. ING2-D1G]
MTLTRAAWIEINLDKLVNNIKSIKSLVNENTLIISVVKSNAYGFGVETIVETIHDIGINHFAVATLNEAIKLRNKFNSIDILVLGYTPNYLFKDAVKNDIALTIFDKKSAEELNTTASLINKKITVHLAIETGMNRIGFNADEESLKIIQDISKRKNLYIEGIFSHFAAAGENDEYTQMQYKRFIDFCNKLADMGINIPIKHICNSHAIISYKEYNLDAIRPGIIQYGDTDGLESRFEGFNIEYIAEVKAEVSHIKKIKKGERVSYGLKYEAPKDTTIATIPIGYSDGIVRQLSGKIDVLIKGRRCPQVGVICMDQMMVNVEGVDCEVGDEVVIVGSQGEERIDVSELAQKAGEVVTSFGCHFSDRLPKVYIKNNQKFKLIDYTQGYTEYLY